MCLLMAASLPGELLGQDDSARCPVVLHQSAPQARDSALQSLEADEIALTGYVRDEATGMPVPNIVVATAGSSQATTTAQDGGYLIRRLNRAGDIPRRPMVKACDLAWEHLTEIREVMLITPWAGTVVVIDGNAMSNPGYAVRLDFVIRQRPPVF